MRSYLVVWAKFRSCHADPVNTMVHMILTPGVIAGILGILSVIAGRLSVIVLLTAYVGHLNAMIGMKMNLFGPILWVASVMTLVLSWWCSPTKSILWSIALLSGCCAGKNLSQSITEEQNIDTEGWRKLLLVLPGYLMHEVPFWEYYYYLLPLVLHSTWLDWDLTITVPQRRIVRSKLSSQEENAYQISRWVRMELSGLKEDGGGHYWNFSEMPKGVRERIESIATCKEVDLMFESVFPSQKWDIMPIWGLNEVSVPPSMVFFTEHVDGPFSWIPCASLYRCVFNLTENTEFYMIFTEIDRKKREVCPGILDIVGFDYNREIQGNTRETLSLNEDFRICLDLYYVIYPKFFLPYGVFFGWCNMSYVRVSRALLNMLQFSINPASELEDGYLLHIIWFCTHVQAKVGFENIVQVFSCCFLSWLLGDYRIRLYSTCFVHYIICLTTWYYRESLTVCYSRFLKNAIFFKVISVVQLAFLCVPLWRDLIHPVRITFLVLGLGISVLAFLQLGIKRTYFGYELKHCTAEWNSSFPYRWIPHPMSFGQILAFLVIASLDLFRDELFWFIRLHIVMCTAQMIQEVFDIHRDKTPESL